MNFINNLHNIIFSNNNEQINELYNNMSSYKKNEK